jgi:hypothetical protein
MFPRRGCDLAGGESFLVFCRMKTAGDIDISDQGQNLDLLATFPRTVRLRASVYAQHALDFLASNHVAFIA